MKKRILFLTKYARLGASSRYRVYQYLPFLEAPEFEYVVRPLFPDNYLRRLYAHDSGIGNLLGFAFDITVALARRWSVLLREMKSYDMVYLEYEALPYLPFQTEAGLFESGLPIIVDYDDPVHLRYEGSANPIIRKWLGSKIDQIVIRSDQVIVGNRHLAEWASTLNKNITVIPTSVDLREYVPDPSPRPENPRPVIGWIGTPVTSRYLRLVQEPLRRLRSRYEFVLYVIGAPDFKLEGVEVVARSWSQDKEVLELRSCDIGIMPLPDEPWARGKSALKLIQYLAAGVVGVASAVGANCEVVIDGKNGFLAGNNGEWVEKLSQLIQQPLLRKTLAQSGRRTVETRYSIQANASSWINVLKRALGY